MSAVPLAIVKKSSALAIATIGDDHEPRTLVPEGRWPAWRPGRRDQLAVSLIELSEPVSSSVQLVSLDGAEPLELYRSQPGVVPVIAPRLPHYLLWSPRGDQLAVVAQGEFGLQLEVVTPGLPFRREVLEVGAPIFSSWSPDGTALASHIGNSLTVFSFAPGGSVTRTTIDEKAVGFRAPACTHDGAVIFATAGDEGAVVIAHSPLSGERRELGKFSGGVALNALPDGLISVSETRQPESGVFDGLWLIDPTSPGNRSRVARGPFASALWSPSGEQVALLVPSHLGDGRYTLQVRSRDGKFVAASEPFLPAQDLRAMFAFWDQYALSHPLWAPDGSVLAVTGRLPTDGVSASFGDPVGNYVYIWRPERGQPMQRLTPGELAFFPPS